jgi:hypothetical protein
MNGVEHRFHVLLYPGGHLPNLVAKPGDAVVFASDCFPSFEELREDFDVLFLLDVLAAIEAAVLHDRLLVTGIQNNDNPILAALLAEGSAVVYDIKDILPNTKTRVDSHPVAAVYSKALSGVLNHTPIPIDEDGGLDLTPLNEEASYFGAGRTVSRVPPIALEVLDLAPTSIELGDAVIRIRKKYSSLRRYFCDIYQVLSEPTVPLKEKLKERADLERAIAVLLAGTKQSDRLAKSVSFASAINDALPPEALMELAEPSGIGIGKLVDRFIESAVDAYWRFKLRPLHSTKDRYLSFSKANIGALVSRHFGVTFDSSDWSYCDRFDNRMSVLIGDASRGNLPR